MRGLSYGSGKRRVELLAALAAVGLAMVGPAPLAAQEPRLPVVVDYVNADGVYLPVGAEQSLSAGDTIDAYEGRADAAPRTRLVFTTVTRRRSIARPLAEGWPTTGDTVYLAVPDVAAPDVEVEASRRPSRGAAAPTARASAPAGAGAARASPAARFSGRLSLDVAGRESRTEWGGDLPGATTRRYATPTTRLAMVGRNLPGGLELRVSARAAYRYSSDFVGPPPTSVRFYELSATRSFSGFRVTAGRFTNPYERYSGFWDGLLLRAGGRSGLGVGVVAGFEPTRANEAPSADLPKLTGFVDFSARGTGWRYETDVSVHLLQAPGDRSERAVGWSQRIGAGPLSLTQRLRLDAGSEGGTSVRYLRVQARLALGGGVRLSGAYSHRGADLVTAVDSLVLGDALAPTLDARDELTAGVGVSGGVGSVHVNAGRSRLDGFDAGSTISVRSSLRVGNGRLLAAGRIQDSDDRSALSVSPGLSFVLFGSNVRASYRHGALARTRALRGHGQAVGGGAERHHAAAGALAELLERRAPARRAGARRQRAATPGAWGPCRGALRGRRAGCS